MTIVAPRQWRNWRENLRGLKKNMEYLLSTSDFQPKLNFVPQTSKTIISVLKSLHPVHFNPLSYIACYVGTPYHIQLVMVHKSQHFYKFVCYKSFILMKPNDVHFLRKRFYPNIFIIHVQKFLFLKFCCVICKYV